MHSHISTPTGTSGLAFNHTDDVISHFVRSSGNTNFLQTMWAGIDPSKLVVQCLDNKTLMSDQIYTSIWRRIKALGLSANGVLNFLETMIYHFPGKIISACGRYEISTPCIIELWGWRRNVTNYLQGDDVPRRKIRYSERVKFLQVALDILDILMSMLPTPNDTIH